MREVVESKERTIGGLEDEVKKVHELEEMEAFSKASGSEREAMLAQELVLCECVGCKLLLLICVI